MILSISLKLVSPVQTAVLFLRTSRVPRTGEYPSENAADYCPVGRTTDQLPWKCSERVLAPVASGPPSLGSDPLELSIFRGKSLAVDG